jgi:hypothetical protein
MDEPIAEIACPSLGSDTVVGSQATPFHFAR